MKKIKLYIILIILMCVILFLFGFFKIYKFNSDKWKNSWVEFKKEEKSGDLVDAYSKLSSRRKMVNYLVKKNLLINLTKEQVVEKIGLEENDFESDNWEYWLNFTASDNKFLVVKFNESNQVINVYTYED
jgi:hypothetical protein